GRPGRRPRADREPDAGRRPGGGRRRGGPGRASPGRRGAGRGGEAPARPRDGGSSRPPRPPQASRRPRALRRDRRGGAPAGGNGVATVTGERAPSALALTWHGVDLAACPPLALAAGALAGRATVTARIQFAPLAGEGTVEVRAGEWRGTAGPLLAVGTLHAERASLGWRLVGDRVALTSLELHGPEVSAEGEGMVRLAAPPEAGGLELRLAIPA